MKGTILSTLGLKEIDCNEMATTNGGLFGVDDITFWTVVGFIAAAYSVVKFGYDVTQGWKEEGPGEEIVRK